MSNHKGSLLVDAMIALLLISMMIFMLSSVNHMYTMQKKRGVERMKLNELVQEATGFYDD